MLCFILLAWFACFAIVLLNFFGTLHYENVNFKNMKSSHHVYAILLFIHSITCIYSNIYRPAKCVYMKKKQFYNQRFDVYKTRRRWSVHFPNNVWLVPRMSRPAEAELVLCQRLSPSLSPINNMATVETYGSSSELEVRYTTHCCTYSVCHCV